MVRRDLKDFVMLLPRVLPCLLLQSGGLVKTKRFMEPVYLGDPRNVVKIFNEKEVDELVLFDILASIEGRSPHFALLKEVVTEAFMPVAYGGGVQNVETVEKLISLGVEKVVCSTHAVLNPNLVKEAANLIGSQSLVVCLDVKRRAPKRYELFIEHGRRATGLDPVAFARQMEDMGAGELIVNSIDRDGTMEGYDFDLISQVAASVNVPVVACGGARDTENLRDVVKKAGASAAAAGSIFVFHGKQRGILINLPDPQTLARLFPEPAGGKAEAAEQAMADTAKRPWPRRGGTNIHIYPSPLLHESRIDRITNTIGENNVFDYVVVLGTWQKGLARIEDQAFRALRRLGPDLSERRSGSVHKLLHLVSFLVRSVRETRKYDVSCVNAHSLTVLPAVCIIKWLTGCKLVYDTHELETETANSGPMRRRISKIVERLLVRHADAIVTVNSSISRCYRESYPGARVWTVRNVPVLRSGSSCSLNLRKALGIGDTGRIYLYLGVIGYGRGIELLLECFRGLPSDHHLVVVGYGELIPLVQATAKVLPNVHYFPPTKPAEIVALASTSDIGIALIENVCRSYYLSLPNKVLEYIASGIPVIVSDFPEMSAVVKKYDCGWTTPVEIEPLRKLILSITADELSEKARKGVPAAKAELNWEAERTKLLDVYSGLFDAV